MNQLADEIKTMEEIVMFTFSQERSIRAAVRASGCSWHRVVKILSSNGVVINELHQKVMKLHEDGRSANEIAKILNTSERTIKAYLPRIRPNYGVNLSENAKRIKKCKEKKKRESQNP